MLSGAGLITWASGGSIHMGREAGRGMVGLEGWRWFRVAKDIQAW